MAEKKQEVKDTAKNNDDKDLHLTVQNRGSWYRLPNGIQVKVGDGKEKVICCN